MEEYIRQKTEELPYAAGRKHIKKFHDTPKAICEPKTHLLQMEALFSLIKMLSRKSGRNTLVVYITERITHIDSVQYLT